MSERGAKPADVPAHIVEAARHVLAADGLEAATLERISSAAGISRMTLHRRGLSKRDILRAIAERLEHDYREAMWPALVAKGNARERLQTALERLCEVSETNGPLLEVLSASVRDAIYHDGPLTKKVFTEPLERLLTDGAVDGSLAKCEAEETATLVFNAVCHTYAHLRAGHKWKPVRARAAVIALVMNGIAVRGNAGLPRESGRPTG